MPTISFGNLRTITWLLGHVDETQEIMRLAPDVQEALSLRPVGNAVKPFVEATIPIQRILAEIIHDCPLLLNQAGPNDGEDAMGSGLLQSAQADALVAGFNWERLLQIARKLEEYLPYILAIFAKQS
jgi:hypothetical protein